jgi:hypothetical protein
MGHPLSLKIVYLAFFLSLLIAACSPKHYVEVRNQSISLYYQNNEADEVLFASSIDQYQFHRARKVEGGAWEVTVPREEEFSYFYLVDKILTLPDCQSKILDDFGAKNCLFVSDM